MQTSRRHALLTEKNESHTDKFHVKYGMRNHVDFNLEIGLVTRNREVFYNLQNQFMANE